MLKIQIIGHIGGDCVIRDVNSKKVINFTVAHTEKRKGNDGNIREFTTWVSCSWWMDNTGIAQYLKKGKQVFVEGSPSVEAYVDKAGKTQATQKINVKNLQLLGGASSSPADDRQQQPNTSQPAANQSGWEPVNNSEDDNLPF